MPPIIDRQFQLIMGDPDGYAAHLSTCPPSNEISTFMEDMIISASGWRKIFAESGIEDDTTEEIAPVATLVAGLMVHSFISFLQNETKKLPTNLTVVLGMDSRPTGPAMADPMLRVLISLGVKVEYLFIVAGPEIMAYVQQSNTIDGFIYISASHNPVGHNGVKFGNADGGVLGGEKAWALIQLFSKHSSSPQIQQRVFQQISHADRTKLQEVLTNQPTNKSRAFKAYYEFTTRVCTDALTSECKNQRVQELKEQISNQPLGILLEMNGSARSTSIDSSWLEAMDLKVELLNSKPREIVHRIVPEGRSLDLCKNELAKLHSKNPVFQLGVVPDCDGDRGNLVFFDPLTHGVREIEAQELFALVVVSELSWLVYTNQLTYSEDGTAKQKVAVVVNGPTSYRVEEIAGHFGVSVFRAEVGEANVVNLAEEKRREGWLVRILGEGSNGGNITHPSKVRDPINTLGSITKLLTLGGMKSIVAQKLSIKVQELQSLADFLAALPTYITTSAYEDRAIMKVTTTDHRALKNQFEQIFLQQWEDKSHWLEQTYGILSWRETNYEGTATKIGFGPDFRSGLQRGGLKIELLTQNQVPEGFLWIRGSGTEPVFRILVDVKGNRPELETSLLTWLRTMIEQADRIVTHST